MNTKDFVSKLSLSAVAGLLTMGSALAEGPVGELQVQGSAQIASAGSEESVRISDTTYGWYSGDRVATRGGNNAVLKLDNGASLGFAEKTAGSVSVDEGVISVSLESGTLLYAVDDQTSELVVESGDYRFSTQASEARALEVSRQSRGASGMIQVGEAGQVEVSVRSGVLSSSNASGSMQYQVVSGESVAFEGADVRQVEVQLGGQDASGEACFGLGDMCIVPFAFGGAVIGTIANYAGDSDDDRQSTSP